MSNGISARLILAWCLDKMIESMFENKEFSSVC